QEAPDHRAFLGKSVGPHGTAQFANLCKAWIDNHGYSSPHAFILTITAISRDICLLSSRYPDKRLHMVAEPGKNPKTERRPLDRIDRRMLQTLPEDGRFSNAALARPVGLIPAPCLERVRPLERRLYT